MSEIAAVELKPWNSRVGNGCGNILISLDFLVVGAALLDREFPVRGWYAIYERSVFVVFLHPKSGKVFLVIQDVVFDFETLKNISWGRDKWRRWLRVDGQNCHLLFSYQRVLWNLIHRPFFAIREVLLADDWWGITCDLPSWVESQWRAGTLVSSMEASFPANIASEDRS